MSLTITVKNTSGTRFDMNIPSLDETVGAFKERLATASGIPAASQRLIFRGHILKDAQTFSEIKSKHGLESGQSMHVVPSPAGAASRASAPTAPSATPPPVQGGVGGGLSAASTLPGMGGGGTPGGGGGLPDMMDMHAQMLRNPEQMAALMNSPIMESIMSNPQTARNLMMANPQVRELMERNPEFAHVFNDPATFRQMMQMARNPSLMNEMMRNTDRQMANIEMMPGGFDALRRMHENIQAPLMDATAPGRTMGNGNGADNRPANGGAVNNDNPFSSLFQQQNTPSNAPMPNPWATNTPGPPPPSATAQPRSTGTAPNTGSNNNAFAQLFQGFGGATPGANPTAAPGTNPGANPGFPGFGLPGLGGDQGVDQMLQMLDDPVMQQLMQNLMSDPQTIERMIASNPQMRATVESNPEMRRMLQDPNTMRAMANPEVLRSIRQLQNAMGNVMGSPADGGTADRNPAAAPTPASNLGGTIGGTMPPPADTAAPNAAPNNANPANNLWAMMNAMTGTGAPPTAVPAPEMTQEQLEDMYSSQLDQLREMGFLDKSMCLQALQQSRGNVSAAIENLLSRFGG